MTNRRFAYDLEPFAFGYPTSQRIRSDAVGESGYRPGSQQPRSVLP
jgi:hypothetical protein